MHVLCTQTLFSTLFILPFSLYMRGSHKCHVYDTRTHPTYTNTCTASFQGYYLHSIAPVSQCFHILDIYPHKVISPALFLFLYHTNFFPLLYASSARTCKHKQPHNWWYHYNNTLIYIIKENYDSLTERVAKHLARFSHTTLNQPGSWPVKHTSQHRSNSWSILARLIHSNLITLYLDQSRVLHKIQLRHTLFSRNSIQQMTHISVK